MRFSREHQRTGDSIRRQLEETERYCRENDLLLEKSGGYIDEGVSAFSGKNRVSGGLARFLDAARSGRIPPGCALVVESLDRLSRQSPMESFGLLKEITDLGIEIHFTATRSVIKRDSDPGMLFLALGSAVRAHEESSLKAERLQAAWARLREKAKTGKVIRSNVPWWLCVKGEKIEPVPEHVDCLQQVFKRAADGDSLLGIARDLNQQGVRCGKSGGRPWTADNLRNLIQSEAPLGIWQPSTKTVAAGRGEVIRGYYPQVVSASLVARARATIEARARRRAKRSTKAGEKPPPLLNLFKGLLRSASNVPAYLAVSNGGTPYYQAIADRVNGFARSVLMVNAALLERVLLTALADLTPEDFAPKETRPEEADVRRLSKVVADLEIKVANLIEAVEAGSRGAAVRLTDRERALEQARRLLTQANAKSGILALGPTPSLFASAIAKLGSNEDREKVRRVLARFVERIYVAKTKKELAETPGFTVSDRRRFSAELSRQLAHGSGSPLESPTPRPKDIYAIVALAGGARRAVHYSAKKGRVYAWRLGRQEQQAAESSPAADSGRT